MVLGPLEESFAVASEDAGHVRVFIAGELVVGVGLRDGEARGVYIPAENDLSRPAIEILG